jgi:hypothetical protein
MNIFQPASLENKKGYVIIEWLYWRFGQSFVQASSEREKSDG